MTTSEGAGGAAKTQPLLAEHERLLDHTEHIRAAALELPSLSGDERQELVDRIVSFLREDLAAHAASEERSLSVPKTRLAVWAVQRAAQGSRASSSHWCIAAD